MAAENNQAEQADLSTEKRRYQRLAFKEPVQYYFNKASDKFGGCLSFDLSSGGLRIVFEEFVPLDTELTIQLKLANSEQLLEFSGRVVWLQRIPFSDRYQVGLEFPDTDASLKSKREVHQYIKSRRF